MFRPAIFAALLLSGCANLSTISRTTPLSDGAIAVHLDSPQRLVYQSKIGLLCAEPTPDALQSYANATGGSVGTRSEAASVSNAFTANALGVGLHTQSITLMRDILYRICEQSYNNRLSNMDVTQLLQRAQDLTLGVLAIEQLTGAVTARQPLMINTASAGAASAINDTQAALAIAKKREDANLAALDAAKSEEAVAKAALDTANAALAAEQAKPAGEQDAAALKVLGEKASALQADFVAKQSARQSAESSYKSAVAATKAIEAMADSRIASSSASSGGSGIFGDPSVRAGLDKASAEAIANATVSIVKAVAYKGHLTDSCMNFFTHQVGGGARTNSMTGDQITAINALCTEVIKANIESFRKGEGGQPLDNDVTAAGTEANVTLTRAPVGTQPRVWREMSAQFKPGATLTKEQLDALLGLPPPAPPKPAAPKK